MLWFLFQYLNPLTALYIYNTFYMLLYYLHNRSPLQLHNIKNWQLYDSKPLMLWRWNDKNKWWNNKFQSADLPSWQTAVLLSPWSSDGSMHAGVLWMERPCVGASQPQQNTLWCHVLGFPITVHIKQQKWTSFTIKPFGNVFRAAFTTSYLLHRFTLPSFFTGLRSPDDKLCSSALVESRPVVSSSSAQ